MKLLALVLALSGTPEALSIPSSDGLTVTADHYPASKDSPLVVLFHQAGWSRGEYLEIAPKLNAMGFGCLAVDLRSGGEVNGVKNETARRATSRGLSTGYTDARKDLVAVLKFARKRFPNRTLIAWGSSYSAALTLQVAGSEPALVDGVLSFSPGEYFQREGKSAGYVTGAAKKIKAPVFVTSSRSEAKKAGKIFQAVPGTKKVHFIPQSRGNHGSRALWKSFDDSSAYWAAVTEFLDTHFPRG
ncbi:MAG: alpha/beta hydrolase [Myxococcota bacterium]